MKSVICISKPLFGMQIINWFDMNSFFFSKQIITLRKNKFSPQTQIDHRRASFVKSFKNAGKRLPATTSTRAFNNKIS